MGHEYVACMMVFGREVMGFDGSVRAVFAVGFSLICLQLGCRGFAVGFVSVLYYKTALLR